MRITSGKFGGRVLRMPKSGDVRPTQDRVREALFSMLMAEIPGCRFLDICAGTGAVGIEALSRGASDVVWIEGDKQVYQVTLRNVREIAGEEYTRNVVCSDHQRWLGGFRKAKPFDVVFADPPYIQTREKDLEELAKLLVKNNIITPLGIFVSETGRLSPVVEWDGWTIVTNRLYGQTRLVLRQLDDKQEEEK